VTYRIVADEISLVKAILTVFASAGATPTSHDVLFCTDQTANTNIETFIMRAMLFSKKMDEIKAVNSSSIPKQ
jgi:hypothetical protein